MYACIYVRVCCFYMALANDDGKVPLLAWAARKHTLDRVCQSLATPLTPWKNMLQKCVWVYVYVLNAHVLNPAAFHMSMSLFVYYCCCFWQPQTYFIYIHIYTVSFYRCVRVCACGSAKFDAFVELSHWTCCLKLFLIFILFFLASLFGRVCLYYLCGACVCLIHLF